MTGADPLARLLDDAADRYSAGYYQGEHEPAYMELLAGVAREHIAAEIESDARKGNAHMNSGNPDYLAGMRRAAMVAKRFKW